MTEFCRASSVAPYKDDAKVSELTQSMLDAGKRLFQLYRLHEDDDMHVARLLELMELPIGARVLDIGCGVGTMAIILHCMRPDLVITLVNISQAQLNMCPPEFERIQADMHAIPVIANSFDAVMICYALGHSLLPQLASELSRLLAPGGQAMIVDIFARSHAPNLAPLLGYVGYVPSRVIDELELVGLGLEKHLGENEFDLPEWIRASLPVDALKGVIPLAMRFRKG